MFRSTALTCLALCLSTLLSANEFDPGKLAAIRDRMQKLVDEGQLSGAVYAVGNSKGIAALEAIGSRNLEAQEKQQPNDLFRIASMTKPITAAGIMILADDGKLSIDDPVEKHLPEFRGMLQVVERTGDTVTLKKPPRLITIKDLCTHTSGIPNFPPGLADIYSTRQRTLAEMTLAISQRPLDFEPGTRWAYCNPGIDTLGRIIEVVSGKSYEQFLADRIFTPLGMTDTGPYLDDKRTPRLATLYGMKDGKLTDVGWELIGRTTNAKHPIPAGGLISSAEDIAKFSQMMLNHGELGGKRILSAAAVKQMTTIHTGDLKCGFTPGIGMGLGWQMVREPQGVTATLQPGTYGHGGAFGTQYWIDPQQDLFVILMIQRSGLPNGDDSVMRREIQAAVAEAVRK